jgi:hypothetical protein
LKRIETHVELNDPSTLVKCNSRTLETRLKTLLKALLSVSTALVETSTRSRQMGKSCLHVYYQRCLLTLFRHPRIPFSLGGKSSSRGAAESCCTGREQRVVRVRRLRRRAAARLPHGAALALPAAAALTTRSFLPTPCSYPPALHRATAAVAQPAARASARKVRFERKPLVDLKGRC